MKVQKIAIDSIKMDKPKPEERTFSREFCEGLARSIEANGLLHEPIVRPIKDDPKGKLYRPITGRNRIYACGKILKWEEIPCKVAPDSMTDDEATAIEKAENLFRLGLDDAQEKKAMSAWYQIYEKTHPLATGKGSATKVAKVVAAKVAEATAKGEVVTEAKKEAIVAEVAAEAKPFSKVLQETLHVSAATAGRMARVAKHLDQTQLDVLEKNKATNETLDKLAALGQKDLIDRAINLIAAGMDHGEAVRQASKAKAALKKADGPTAEQKSVAANARAAAPKSAPKPKDSELTDDDWLSHHCDPVLKNLKRRGPFKRDAILYRRIIDTLSKLRGSLKKPLQEAKHPDGNGPFYAVVNKLVKALHPSQWLVCGVCNGTGSVVGTDSEGKEAKNKCPKCFNGAYILKLDD